MADRLPRESSRVIYDKLLRGEATPKEYVDALKAELPDRRAQHKWIACETQDAIHQLIRERDEARAQLDGFRDGLTAALNAAGVPATPSWPEAIDHLVRERERARAEAERLRKGIVRMLNAYHADDPEYLAAVAHLEELVGMSEQTGA